MKRGDHLPARMARGLFLVALAALIGFPGVAAADWKSKIVRNQIKVAEYITVLQQGGDPDKLARPTLRRDERSRANAANREMREMMEAAEKLARRGQHAMIKDPVFTVELVSPETYRALENEYSGK